MTYFGSSTTSNVKILHWNPFCNGLSGLPEWFANFLLGLLILNMESYLIWLIMLYIIDDKILFSPISWECSYPLQVYPRSIYGIVSHDLFLFLSWKLFSACSQINRFLGNWNFIKNGKILLLLQFFRICTRYLQFNSLIECFTYFRLCFKQLLCLRRYLSHSWYRILHITEASSRIGGNATLVFRSYTLVLRSFYLFYLILCRFPRFFFFPFLNRDLTFHCWCRTMSSDLISRAASSWSTL